MNNAEKHLLFTPWLRAWEEAFSAYLAQHQTTLTPQERKGAMVLKAHHLVAEILTDVDLSLGELGWDAFHDKFNAIVDLATAVLEDSTLGEESTIDARWKSSGVFISSQSAQLSFSLGIVDPLFEVCARCRDPMLRRKALDLLARHPRQEGMWSSWSAWKVGRFVMRLEEEGLETVPKQQSDIPSTNRVSEAWFDFSDGSKGRVAYKRGVPRATPRMALNPGLFQDSKLSSVAHRSSNKPSSRPESSGSGFSHRRRSANSTEGSLSTAPASETYGSPGQFDLEAAEYMPSVYVTESEA